MDLKPFLSTDETRPGILKPFSEGEFTFATDARIIVRVPRQPDVPENSEAPQKVNARLFDHDFAKLKWRPLPQFTAPKVAKCRHCKGSGKCRCAKCREDYERECAKCAGEGKIEQHLPGVWFLGALVAPRYLARIAALDKPQMTLLKDGLTFAFRFQGGDGLLMALRATADDMARKPK